QPAPSMARAGSKTAAARFHQFRTDIAVIPPRAGAGLTPRVKTVYKIGPCRSPRFYRLPGRIDFSKVAEKPATRNNGRNCIIVCAPRRTNDMATATHAKPVTTKELLSMPENSMERWLIRGHVREIPMTKRNRFHSRAMVRISTELENW